MRMKRLYIYDGWPSKKQWYINFITDHGTAFMYGSGADQMIERAIMDEVPGPVKIKYAHEHLPGMNKENRNMNRSAWIEMPAESASMFLMKWNY